MATSNDEPTPPQIVVGVDDSPQSAAALKWAAAYATRTGAQLHLVYVWERTPSAMYGTSMELQESSTKDAHARLTLLVTNTIGETVEPGGWRLDVVEGSVGPTLVDLAEDADLLVVGTGEHTGVRRLVAGSVSHYCLSHARGPVLAVPSGRGHEG